MDFRGGEEGGKGGGRREGRVGVMAKFSLLESRLPLFSQ